MGCRIARNKILTSRLLHDNLVPVPPAGLASDWAQAQALARELGWSVVVKPADLDGGEGVMPGIRTKAELAAAYETARALSAAGVIVERHVAGDDHRMMVGGGGNCV